MGTPPFGRPKFPPRRRRGNRKDRRLHNRRVQDAAVPEAQDAPGEPAMSGSWVTKMMVMPSPFNPLQQVHDVHAGLGVEGPRGFVGQDQRRWFARARAMATRCCCPPDSLRGW